MREYRNTSRFPHFGYRWLSGIHIQYVRFLILAQYPESRRMLPVMHLKVLNFYEGSHLLLHLLIGLCPVFYPVCLSFRNVDAQFLHQQCRGSPGIVGVFGFPFAIFFVIFTSQLSSILFTGSYHARFLILAQQLEPRRMLPVMYLKVLNFYEGSHLLLHLLIGLCPVFYRVCLFSSDAQFSHQRSGDRLRESVCLFISCDFY